jgi:hypothetical protein
VIVLIVLVEAMVVVGLIYAGVRFGVRDGMADYERRKREEAQGKKP